MPRTPIKLIAYRFSIRARTAERGSFEPKFTVRPRVAVGYEADDSFGCSAAIQPKACYATIALTGPERREVDGDGPGRRRTPERSRAGDSEPRLAFSCAAGASVVGPFDLIGAGLSSDAVLTRKLGDAEPIGFLLNL